MSVEMVTCPKCASQQTCRSRARSFRERVRKRFTKKRLYRCRDCDWRGWVVPTVVQGHSPDWIAKPDSISLAALDAALCVRRESQEEATVMPLGVADMLRVSSDDSARN
jgi:hypothetical protein